MMSPESHTQERQEEVEQLTEQNSAFRFLKRGLHKAVDATILNTHPCGAPIDGMVRMDGEFVKDTVDATVLNKHPCGANVDHAVNLF